MGMAWCGGSSGGAYQTEVFGAVQDEGLGGGWRFCDGHGECERGRFGKKGGVKWERGIVMMERVATR